MENITSKEMDTYVAGTNWLQFTEGAGEAILGAALMDTGIGIGEGAVLVYNGVTTALNS